MVLKYPSRIAQRHSSIVKGCTAASDDVGKVFIHMELATTIVTTVVNAIISLELLTKNIDMYKYIQ